MDTKYLPDSIEQKIDTYNETHASWVGLKYFQMATCAAALLGTFFVNEEHRDKVLGLSAVAGLTAYGIHRREENRKQDILNDVRHFEAYPKMSWVENEEYFYATKAKEKKEKESVKIIGTGLACFIMGQPVLGSILTVGGLLHNTTSRDFIKVQDRLLSRYETPAWRKQNER